LPTARTAKSNARLLVEGNGLFGQHAGAVQARAGTLRPADVIDLVRNPT